MSNQKVPRPVPHVSTIVGLNEILENYRADCYLVVKIGPTMEAYLCVLRNGLEVERVEMTSQQEE